MNKLIAFATYFIFLICLCERVSSSNIANNYKVNDGEIDVLFSESEDISKMDFAEIIDFLPFSKSLKSNFYENNVQKVAGAIAIASVVLAVGIIFPFHRFIIGTGGEPFKIFALYCITLGGCGVITLVDGIILVLDETGTKYQNNNKFIMWDFQKQ